jgi:outer membrane protein assembly factor BamB
MGSGRETFTRGCSGDVCWGGGGGGGGGGGNWPIGERFVNNSGIYYMSPYTITASIGSCSNTTVVNVNRSLIPIQIALPCSNWQTFHHDNDHKGYTTGNWTGMNRTIWTYDFGDPAQSSPTVADGVVFTGSGETSRVYAFNAFDGTEVWNYTTGSYVVAAPAVAYGMVYAGSYDGKLYALDERDGTQIWNYTTGNWIMSAPTVANDIVYFGSNDNSLYAINATDGTQIWNYTTGGQIHTSPAVANGIVYFGSNDNNIYAINATNGSKIWNYTTGSWVQSSPAVSNGVVFIGSQDTKLYALNATNGTKLWNYTTTNYVDSSPAVHSGVVYVGSDDTHVYAFNATTGAQLWNYTTGNYVKSSPAISNGIVYILSDDGNTYALNATTGAKIWNITIESSNTWSLASSPAVAYGYVYVTSWNNERIYAFGPSIVTISITSPAASSTTGKTAWLNATTNINATCKYGTAPNPSTSFTGGQNTQTHSQQLTSLSNGANTYYVNCTDGHGNYSESSVSWTVDAAGPAITVITPQNVTYGSTVVFNITTSEPSSLCKFSLSGAANVSMSNSSSTAWYYVKSNLTDGAKNINFYCNDSYNNMNSTGAIYFSVNTSFAVSITSPINKTYTAEDVDVNVTTSMAANTCTVSLDGKADVTLSNSTTTNWYGSETGLSEGAHNVSVWCKNTYGLSDLKTRYFSVDTLAPTVTIATPANTTYAKTVVFNVSTDEAASFCKYSLDGTTNVSMTNSSLTRWTTTNSSMANGGHNVVFYCSDLAGNIGTATRVFTSDIIAPTIGNWDTLTTYKNNAAIAVVVHSVSDAGSGINNGANCNFKINGSTSGFTGTVTYVAAQSLCDGTITLSGTLADGTYLASINVSDNVGNYNYSSQQFKVDTTNPAVTIVSPSNTTYGNTLVWFNVTVVDNNKDQCKYSLDGAANVTMTQSGPSSWYANNSTWSGSVAHTIVYYCNDTAGNIGTATRVFTVDTVAPTITIASPTDSGTYGKTVVFNVSTSEPAAWCKSSLAGMNTSLTNSSTTRWTYTNTSVPNGSYALVYYCADLYGNVGSSSKIDINIDAFGPTITIVVPQNSTYGKNVTFSITSSEAASTCKFSLDSAANVTMTNTSATAWEYPKTNMAETGHSIKFYCTDVYNNTNVSSTMYFSVNTSFLATITYPANQHYNTVNITANVSTNADADVCLIGLDGGANASMSKTSATAWYYDMTSLSEATHNLSVWCNNSAGTLYSTATGSFTVDTTKPTITVVSPLNTTYGKTVIFNATTNEIAASCTYSLDSAANVSMSGSTTTWSKSNTNMTGGSHNVKYYCTDLAGNVNNTATTYFTVDATPPSMTMISPANTTYGSTSVLFNVTTSEAAAGCTINLDGNSADLTDAPSTVWTATMTGLAQGSHRASATCEDLYDNTNTSGTVYFTVDTMAPTVTLVKIGRAHV